MSMVGNASRKMRIQQGLVGEGQGSLEERILKERTRGHLEYASGSRQYHKSPVNYLKIQELLEVTGNLSIPVAEKNLASISAL